MVEFSYKNEGCRMVVLRCIGPSNFFLERVLFPTDILTFKAPKPIKSKTPATAAEGTKPPIAKEEKYINKTKTSLIISIKTRYL